jgi:hypothetical protein
MTQCCDYVLCSTYSTILDIIDHYTHYMYLQDAAAVQCCVRCLFTIGSQPDQYYGTKAHRHSQCIIICPLIV